MIDRGSIEGGLPAELIPSASSVDPLDEQTDLVILRALIRALRSENATWRTKLKACREDRLTAFPPEIHAQEAKP